MKSREEYLASIYTKKYALLAKRKKNIRIAVSAVCIAICICSATVVMPKAMNKSDNNAATSTTTTLQVTKPDYSVSTEIPNSPYEDATEYTPKGDLEEIGRLEGIESEDNNITAETETEIALETKPSVNNMFDHSASATPEFGYEECPDIFEEPADFPIVEPEYYTQVASPYADEEIADKAYGYLSDEEKKACKNVEPFITFTHMKNGQYYSVYYNLDGRTIIVELDWNTLDLISKKNLATTTKKPSDSPTMTTPAYNPNEQKEQM